MEAIEREAVQEIYSLSFRDSYAKNVPILLGRHYLFSAVILDKLHTSRRFVHQAADEIVEVATLSKLTLKGFFLNHSESILISRFASGDIAIPAVKPIIVGPKPKLVIAED